MKTAIPRVSASGTNFDAFRSAGFAGIVDRLMTTNEFSPATNAFLRESKNGRIVELFSVLRGTCDRFVCGEMIDTGKFRSDLASAVAGLAALTQAASEIATLVEANPGTLTSVHKFNQLQAKTVRQFP